jgi:hypothetical protein
MGAKIAILAAGLALAAGPAAAADGWSFSGTFRVREEAIADQFRPAPAASDDRLLSLRTTFFAEYAKGPWRVGGELFDSRGYGERTNSTTSTSEVNAFELGQAYVGLDLDAGSLTVGRFTMDAGSRRLIARNRFRNTINAFTGARWDGNAGADRYRVFWTLPQTREPSDAQGVHDNDVQWDRESPDLQFFGGSWTHEGVLGGALEVYGYGLAERDSARIATRNRRLFTPGVRLARKAGPGRNDYEIEAIYQTGRERASTKPTDVADLDVSAWFLHAEAGHTFDAAWSPRLALQYDLASGDRGKPGEYGRFDTLFGARRGEYGPTSLWGAVQRANLNSPAVRLSIAPTKRLDGFVAARLLWLESATDSFASTGVRDPSGRSGKFAGEQVEAQARYWLVPKAVRLETGLAWLGKGRFLKDAPNAPKDGDSSYGYVDVTFGF